MSRFWSDHVEGLAPYIPGEQPKVADLLKLNTNENPYGPSPRALAAIQAAADDGLRLYPDPESSSLRDAIAHRYGVMGEQVFLGNGSDEILAHIFNGLFLRNRRPLLMPDITYSFYKTYCTLYAVPHEIIPLVDDFSICVDDYVAPRAVAPAGIIFANPNAPTGMALGLAEIARIAGANPDTAVVVDEAYVDFGADSAVALLPEHENVVVVHTFSKSRALAGLRVGFAIGSVETVAGLQRVKDSFNSYPLDRLAQAGAMASIGDQEWFEEKRQAVIAARGDLMQGLEALGFEVLPSLANFVFARHPSHAGPELATGLRTQSILVRHFMQPRIRDFLRITVGAPQDCQRLLRALADLCRSPT